MRRTQALTEEELDNIHLRNETVRFAKHLGVKDRGIDIISEIHDLHHQMCILAPMIMKQLAEQYGEFESLHPGVMAKIHKHRVSITYGKGKSGRRRSDKITRALRLRNSGKEWNEIIVRILGEKECRAMGPSGRKKLIRHYQIATASRRKRERQQQQTPK